MNKKEESQQHNLMKNIQEISVERLSWENSKDLNLNRGLDLEKQVNMLHVEINRVKALHERLLDMLKNNMAIAVNETIGQHLKTIESASKQETF